MVSFFEVPKQPDFLKDLRAELMRFVDDQGGDLSLALAFQQQALEFPKALGFTCRDVVHAEIQESQFKELRGSQRGIQNETELKAAGRQELEDSRQKRRLASPCRARQYRKTFSLQDCVCQADKTFAMLLCQE